MLFTFAMITQLGFSQILIEHFNDDSQFTKSESFFTDGSGDYFGIIDPTDGSTNDFDNNPNNNTPSGLASFTGITGNYLTGEDLNGEGGNTFREITWSNININGYTNLNISIDLGAVTNKFDAGEGIKLEYKIDAGSYTEIFDFTSPGGNSALTDGVTSLNLVLQTITENIPSTGVSLDLKLTVRGEAGDEQFVIDELILNGTAPSTPTIGFDAATSSQTETDATFNVNLPVTVSNYDGNQIDVNVSVTGGTAEAGDYTLNTSTLSYTADGSQNISLDIIPDTEDFDDETIILTITETSSVTGLVISQSTHTVTINDDENPPTIGFDTATSSQTETNTTFNVSIPVTVSDYSGTQIDVSVASSGTAEGADFTLNTTSLSFTTDESQNISLDINADADADKETVILTLTETSSVTGLVISTSQHTVTITDDEIPPVPTAGSVFITEILDSENGFNNDYLELFNNSNETVSLATSKLLRFSSAGAYEYSFDFGVDESTASVDVTIPANGFLIIARGSSRSSFNTANSITLNPSVNFNGGHSDLYFGTGRRWKLKTGGTADTDDGTLIDDTLTGVGSTKDYRNIFTDTFVTETPTDGTPGELEYLVYSGGAWVNSVAMDGTTATKDAYFYDNYTVSSNASVNNIGVASGNSFIVNTSSTLTVTGSVTYNRNITTPATTGDTNLDKLEGWHLMSSPVTGQAYGTTWADTNEIASGTASNRGIATYNNTVASSNWVYSDGTTSTFATGAGYSIKRTTTGDVSFTGTLNTGDISDVAITTGTTSYNLVGNPYTAYINSATFLTTNTSLLDSETIWIWDSSTKNYVAKMTGDAFKIAPGQGFFIKASAGGNLTFEETSQSHETDTFLKAISTEIVLSITDGNSIRFAKVRYKEGSSKAFDNGFDGETFKGIPNSFDIYTQLLSNNINKNYQIQSLPNSDYENMVIPVGVNAISGKEITFTAEALNLPSDTKVFLEDRLTNVFTRLDKTNSEYKITLSEALNGTGRFYIHTTQSALSVKDDAILNSISIFKSDASTLKIIGFSQGNANIKLFSITGKQVMNASFKTIGAKYISLPKLAKGVYIVQLETQNGKLNKKIILE
ncbi:hypothetical protein PHEL85_2609 [Polaribacter sp. Hel1_85]|nr:hypothetical protein PHEL85_2609 [Polaribacter sp. Hel1_85]